MYEGLRGHASGATSGEKKNLEFAKAVRHDSKDPQLKFKNIIVLYWISFLSYQALHNGS
jgi:hypothetical protein